MDNKVQADDETVREFVYLVQDKPIKFFEEKVKEIDEQIEILRSRQEKEYPSRSRAVEIETLKVERSYCMTQIRNHQIQGLIDKYNK